MMDEKMLKRSLATVGLYIDLLQKERAKIIRLMTPEEEKKKGLDQKQTAQLIKNRRKTQYKKSY